MRATVSNNNSIVSNVRSFVLQLHELKGDVLEALDRAAKAGNDLEVQRQNNRLLIVEFELQQAGKLMRKVA